MDPGVILLYQIGMVLLRYMRHGLQINPYRKPIIKIPKTLKMHSHDAGGLQQ